MTEKSQIVKLGELIVANAVRVDRGTNDSVDVGFFGIKLADDSDLTALKLKNAIVRAEDGADQSLSLKDLTHDDGLAYTVLGIWLGDQGLGLALLGLGKLLGLWDVVLPSDAGVTDALLEQQMIGMGFVKLHVGPDSILRA